VAEKTSNRRRGHKGSDDAIVEQANSINWFLHSEVMAYDRETSRTQQVNRTKLLFQPTECHKTAIKHYRLTGYYEITCFSPTTVTFFAI